MDESLGEEYFIDFMPNCIKNGITEHAENFLKNRLERELPHRVARWGELPIETVRVKPFQRLFTQARQLYIEGYLEAVMALCGMTVEALCIAIAEDRVTDRALEKKLTDPRGGVRRKIKELKKYLKGDYSVSLLNDTLDIRRRYLHLHEMQVDPKDVLECVNKLHLVLLAEYGIFPRERGLWRVSTREDVEERAKKMGIELK